MNIPTFVQSAAALLLGAAAAAAGAEPCIHVVDSGFERQDDGTAVPVVEWYAALENRCDRGYDADLEVRFVDAEGELLYRVNALTTLTLRGSGEAGARVYIPKHYLPDLEEMEVRLEERERPF